MADATPKAPAPVKYKIKNGDVLAYPGFKAQVTNDHLNGPNSETFIKAFKKLDEKSKKNDFDRLIETVK